MTDDKNKSQIEADGQKQTIENKRPAIVPRAKPQIVAPENNQKISTVKDKLQGVLAKAKSKIMSKAKPQIVENENNQKIVAVKDKTQVVITTAKPKIVPKARPKIIPKTKPQIVENGNNQKIVAVKDKTQVVVATAKPKIVPKSKPKIVPKAKQQTAENGSQAVANKKTDIENKNKQELLEDKSTYQVEDNKNKRQKMFISVLAEQQVEVIVAEEGRISEYYVEMNHQQKTKGNIYKGYIHNIDSSLQAAFINYGAERNGFLQIDEVHPEYYREGHKPKGQQRYPLIQHVLHVGQEILVQVVKEPTGKKGAFLSSYLSLPGRIFVYTIGRGQKGVSRKIEDEKERARLKEILETLKPEDGIGLIIRTAGVGKSKTDLLKDYKYLQRLWADMRKKVPEVKAPNIIYQEMGLATRAVRDYLTGNINEVWIDDEDVAKHLLEFMTLAFPRSGNMIKIHDDSSSSLFERFNLSKQVEQIYGRDVQLPSGGQLVFDQTEALTSVDINSGKIGGEKNFQKMVLKTNIEAAAEIARQIKLRDIGGQIVIDFIEMRDAKHRKEVEKTLQVMLKEDRAQTDMENISPFGLLQLVRQRLGSSAIAMSTEPCPCCGGTGIRRNLEWQSLQALKEIQLKLRKNANAQDSAARIEYVLDAESALYLFNQKKEFLLTMEKTFDVKIDIKTE